MLQAVSDFVFHCYQCHTQVPLEQEPTCPECGAPLSLAATAYPDAHLFDAPPTSLWDYRALLPIPADATPVSLGEGNTPVVDAPKLADKYRLGAVDLKNEMANPTGSFKDRQIAVGITWARALGHDTVAVVSSGNVAASTAAYATRAGLRAVLFMHGQAAPAKIAQAQAYGATVIQVDNPSPRAVFALCLEACKAFGWYHLSTAGIYEPWNVEGAKTIAYELYQHYGNDLPHWIVAPVGGGGLVGGIWRGFLDLKAMGLIQDIPRLAGVQATGCAPLKEAMDQDWTVLEHLAHPWEEPDTIAGAIADDILFDGHTVLHALRQTWGAAVTVSDEEMVDAQRRLARRSGLLCEIATAAAIAALAKLPVVDRATRVCCIVSGSGLKDLGRLAAAAVPAPVIPAELSALRAVLDRP
jgi:threonine synthase